MDFKKRIVGTLIGAAAGVVTGAILGPSAGITAACDLSRRWINDKK